MSKNLSLKFILPALISLITTMFAVPAAAETLTFEAGEFGELDRGEIPFYYEDGRGALAINAANEAYRGPYAEASVAFAAEAGVFDVSLVSLQEIDGECDYQVYVNDVLIAEFVNDRTETDYLEQQHTVSGISIPAGATLVVAARADTNGLIPEGDGTAWARGRWRRLTLERQEAPPATVALAISQISLQQDADNNDQQQLVLRVANSSDSVTATGVVVTAEFGDAVKLAGSSVCAATETGVSCPLAEIGPNGSTDLTMNLQVAADSQVDFIVSADQPDSGLADNTLSVALTAGSGGTETDSGGSTGTDQGTGDDTGSTETDTEDQTDSSGTDTGTDGGDNGDSDSGTGDETGGGSDKNQNEENDQTSGDSGSRSGGATGPVSLALLSAVIFVFGWRRR